MQKAIQPATKVRLERATEQRFTRTALIVMGVILLFLFILPFVYNKANLKAWGIDPFFGVQPSALIGQLADVAQYVLLALGLNIVVGFAGLLDLGYAAFFAIGAFTYAFIASPQLTGITNGYCGANGTSACVIGIHLPFWIAIFISAIVAAIFGALLGAPTLRLRGDYLAIVTLGFGEIVPAVFLNLNNVPLTRGLTGGPDGISGVDPPAIATFGAGTDVCNQLHMLPNLLTGGCKFTSTFISTTTTTTSAAPYYYLFIIIVVILIFAVTNLRSSRLGRAWMAIREDEIAAAAMGIDTVKTKLLAFSSGAALAGVAGAMYASKLNVVSPSSFSFNVSVFILCMIILGGIGNIYGVIAGAIILQLTQSVFLTNLPNNLHDLGTQNHIDWLANTDWSGLKFLTYGVILVVLMIVRPEGLIPSARRKAELRGETGDVASDVAGPGAFRSDEAERANPIATAERENLYDVRNESEEHTSDVDKI
jgi:branched-chain amino acid transport system permease protein